MRGSLYAVCAGGMAEGLVHDGGFVFHPRFVLHELGRHISDWRGEDEGDMSRCGPSCGPVANGEHIR